MQVKTRGFVFARVREKKSESMLFLGLDTRRGKSGTESEARETKLGVRQIIQMDLKVG